MSHALVRIRKKPPSGLLRLAGSRRFAYLSPAGILVPRHRSAAARIPHPAVGLDEGIAATDPQRPFRVYDELAELVLRWERCTLPRPDWDHRAHLAVAAWHLAQFTECEATDRVINGIRRYNHSQGIEMTPTGGYHETLTLFWLRTARHFLDSLEPTLSLLEKVNAFVLAFARARSLHLEYYSEKRITSWQARVRWVEPDLKPLDT